MMRRVTSAAACRLSAHPSFLLVIVVTRPGPTLRGCRAAQAASLALLRAEADGRSDRAAELRQVISAIERDIRRLDRRLAQLTIAPTIVAGPHNCRPFASAGCSSDVPQRSVRCWSFLASPRWFCLSLFSWVAWLTKTKAGQWTHISEARRPRGRGRHSSLPQDRRAQ